MNPRTRVVALAFLAACSTTPSGAPPTHVPSTSTSSRPGASSAPTEREVPELWRFDAERVGGGSIQGASFAGDKVAVWLWAPW